MLAAALLVERVEDPRGIDAEREHLGGGRERLRIGVRVLEPARVGHERGEDALRGGAIELPTEFAGDAPHEQARGRGRDVDVAGVPPGRAVVDVVVDDELLRGLRLEHRREFARARELREIEQHRDVVHGQVGAGESAQRHLLGEVGVALLGRVGVVDPDLATLVDEQARQRRLRTEAIAIRALVPGEHEAPAAREEFEGAFALECELGRGNGA